MLPTPLYIPATFRDVPSKIGVIPKHQNVRYVYYNKIQTCFDLLSDHNVTPPTFTDGHMHGRCSSLIRKQHDMDDVY